MKHYISLSLMMVFTILAFGNPINRFPENRAEFMKELKAYLAAAKKKEALAAYDHFEQQLSVGLYDEPEVLRIINVSNKMVDRKLAADPYFSDFLKGLTVLKENKSNHFLADSWYNTLEDLLSSSEIKLSGDFQKLLVFSIGYFEKSLLSSPGSGINWRAGSTALNFDNVNGEPCLKFDETDLICFKREKEMLIKDTRGAFFPGENRWRGKGGVVTWARVDMAEVYCEFDIYDIPLGKGTYKIEKAWFSHPEYFKGEKIEGVFTDKLTAQEHKPNGSYPIFISTSKQLEIPFEGSSLTYKGGIHIKGKTFYGVGNDSGKALLKGYGVDKTQYFEARSKRFVIDKKVAVSGEETAATIFFGQDSVYHPAVKFKFRFEENKLSLQRGDRGTNRNPFFNSLTQMNIDSERLDWDLATTEVIVNEKKASLGNINKRVSFESAAYFDEQDYRKLQSVASIHPLAVLKSVADKEKKQLISALDYAQAINPRFDVGTINSLIYDLLGKGYIRYDKDKKEIEVLDKVFHYCDASQDKKDYDIIKILSKSDKTNARLLLNERKIVAVDVGVVEFSSFQKVAARPYKGQLTIGNNRSMDFDGKIFAGLASFEGKDFTFDYDPFVLKLDSVEFYDLFVGTGKKGPDGSQEAFSIASRIENTSGVLLIDAPSNKSGREDITTFPAFKTKSPAYIYYDFEETLNACYSRDSFYFKLDPFTLNALDEFKVEHFRFKGKMISAGIFPDFEETLILQEKDHSLGFVHQTPASGYEAYAKGKFNGNIDLSNSGLMADGTIKYMWATLESEDMIFKPKQMTATANSFTLDEALNSNIPKVKGETVGVDWRPQKDSMYIKSLDKPFELFQTGEHKLKDMLILTPDGLKGRGVFDWPLGQIDADLFSFGSHSLKSDTANLKVKIKGFNDLALHTQNVFTEIDFVKNQAYVQANFDTITTDFPYNKYRTSMNAFNWDIDKEQITFLSGTDKAGTFLALSKEADSLHFSGRSAKLDLKTNKLMIGGVPNILVADASVVPNDGNVMILPDGEMPALENARIIASTKNEYHIFNKANVNIKNRNAYTALGYYEYPVGEKRQEIKFDNISASNSKKLEKRKRGITMATTNVDLIYIDEPLKYKGNVSIEADQDYLLFDGFAQMDWTGGKSDWFELKGQLDKETAYFSYGEKVLSNKGDLLYTGLFVNKYTGVVYPAFMNKKRNEGDPSIFTCTGLMDYNPAKEEYFFGDSVKVVSHIKQGQLMNLKADATVTAEGNFNIGPKHALVNTQIVGQTNVDQNKETSVTFDFMAGLNIYLPEKMMSIIYKAFNENSFQLRPIQYKQETFYDMALANWIPEAKVMKTTLAELKAYNELQIPQQYNDFTFMFSNLNMVWNPNYQSFISSTPKLGLNSINKAIFNKEVEAYLEFRKFDGEADGLSLYLVAPNGQFYFISYRNHILSTCSDDEQYMLLLNDLSKKERSKKVKGGEPIEIQGVSIGRAKQFVERVKEGKKG